LKFKEQSKFLPFYLSNILFSPFRDYLRLFAMTVATESSFKTKEQSETSLSMPLKIHRCFAIKTTNQRSGKPVNQ
jgi:hypothetical protein